MDNFKELVRIPCGQVQIEGALEVPEHPIGFVVFAHGSGSSRFSPRNNYVAEVLRGERIGTLLLDLLTPEEDAQSRTRFNIPLLTERLSAAVEWLHRQAGSKTSPIGLFGASTGAAAALQLAALPGAHVVAVVSRGGRPDLAGKASLEQVSAPTLLIVGGNDTEVIELNKAAYKSLHCEKRIEIVAGATHLFEEPGALEVAAEIACEWFFLHFSMHRRP
jgi:pimeloyl-ACP methyl ester carboxylesterase